MANYEIPMLAELKGVAPQEIEDAVALTEDFDEVEGMTAHEIRALIAQFTFAKSTD